MKKAEEVTKAKMLEIMKKNRKKRELLKDKKLVKK
jgi:hypothetical protein